MMVKIDRGGKMQKTFIGAQLRQLGRGFTNTGRNGPCIRVSAAYINLFEKIA